MTRKTVELIERLQCDEHRARRMHGILRRIGNYAQQKSIKLDAGNDTIEIECSSAAKAQLIAMLIGIPLDLVYLGSRTYLEASIEARDITFHFKVTGRRTVTIDVCHVHRIRRPSLQRWKKAKLFFNDLELSDLQYEVGDYTPKELKADLYDMAKKIWQHKYDFQ